ncbi:hypothetical protein HPB50_014783 [Hyalomma asiaticum]|uniref:Uncharacterized protein n=1 Tax=Hyalomma asiaticum TaxID=266040 RepID=A0ACB7TKJ5_HYAAI|nr:hypothetical protein HPB50_014783 [Hyalomma asiaticum]
MTPVFTPGLTQGHYGGGKRRPYQFRQAELVMAEDPECSTTAVVASGGPSMPLVLFITHSSELLHYAPSFCKWTTCRLPAKHHLEFKARQPNARPVALCKRTSRRPRSSVAVQALQIRRLRTVRSPATTELTHSLHRRLRVEPTACGPMAVIQLVRRQYVKHHARNTGHRPATFVSTLGVLSCSLDARLTASVPERQCSPASSKWSRADGETRRSRVIGRVVRQHERGPALASCFSA